MVSSPSGHSDKTALKSLRNFCRLLFCRIKFKRTCITKFTVRKNSSKMGSTSPLHNESLLLQRFPGVFIAECGCGATTPRSTAALHVHFTGEVGFTEEIQQKELNSTFDKKKFFDNVVHCATKQSARRLHWVMCVLLGLVFGELLLGRFGVGRKILGAI